MSGIKTFSLSYTSPLVLQPNEHKLLYFDKIILTNFPAKCILYGDPYLYLHGLSSNINIINTNDSYPSIIITNFTNNKLEIKPYTVNVYITIVLSHKNC